MTASLKETIAIPKKAQAARRVVYYRDWSHLAFWGFADSVAKAPSKRADDSQRSGVEELAGADMEIS